MNTSDSGGMMRLARKKVFYIGDQVYSRYSAYRDRRIGTKNEKHTS